MSFGFQGWNASAVFAIWGPIALWSVLTIALYIAAKYIYHYMPRWWTTPLIVTSLLLIAVIALSHTSYSLYISETRWLIVLLGPATVSFAVPVYEQRSLIRRHWLILAIGVLIGSSTAILSAWGLASMLGLDGDLRLSLLPRSISTPFAMTVSKNIGGVPELTAVFVILTGIIGAAWGEFMLNWMPLRSTLARGALFGMGAHVIGANRSYQLNQDEGSVAGLVMMLVGISNVLVAPLLAHILK